MRWGILDNLISRWILEMYAFSIASSQAPNGPIRYELHPELMAQPPWDNHMQVAKPLFRKSMYVVC